MINPFPNLINGVSDKWHRFIAWEKQVEERLAKNTLLQFFKKYQKLIVGVQFAFLLYSRGKAIDQRDSYRKANEVLVNERVHHNGFFESNEVTRWKKRMLTDSDGITSFRMMDVSESYESTFLEFFNLSVHDYIGYTDFQVWSKEIAQEFYDEDLYVATTGNSLYVVGKDPRGGRLLIIKERKIEGTKVFVVGRAIQVSKAKEWFTWYERNKDSVNIVNYKHGAFNNSIARIWHQRN